MKTLKKFYQLEHGQVIPIVVIGVLVLIAMSALIIDGGALLTNRRKAQNAADAAALAGARVFCKQDNYTIDDVNAAITLYATENEATVIWDETGISYTNLNTIEGLKKGEVVVTVQVEHDSFFAPIFKLPFFGEKTEDQQDQLDILAAQAVAAAGCFPYGGTVVLPIAFPCYPPTKNYDSDNLVDSDDCDYVMLKWEYFVDVATGPKSDGNCGMTYNPLLGGGPISPGDAECISDKLYADYKEFIYIVVNEEKYCAMDPENMDPTNEIICELTGGRTQLNSAARGWLNLHAGNAGTATLQNWIGGINNPVVRIHNWMSFLGGTRANPIFDSLSDRLFDIVWIPVFNETCDYKPVVTNPLDPCMVKAHQPEKFSVPSGMTCDIVDGNPGQVWAHVIAYAPFFTSCVREGSKDLENHIKANGYDPEGFEADCPGFGLAVGAEYEAEDGSISYPNMVAFEKTGYSFEGYFIEPWWLDNPESISIGGADLKLYIVSLTR